MTDDCAPSARLSMNRRLLLCYLGLAACFGLLVVAALFRMNYGALAGVAVGVVLLGIIELRALATLTYPVVALCGTIFSLALVENGAYIGEQRRYGFNIGATAWLGLYALSFLAVAHLAIWLFAYRIRRRSRQSIRPFIAFLIVVGIGISLFYVFVFISYGTGLGSATRFVWFDSLPPIAKQLNNALRSFAFPAFFGVYGYATWIQRRPRPWMLIASAPITAMVLMSEKFSSYFYAVSMLVAGLAIGAIVSGAKIRLKRIHLGIAAAIAVALFAAVLLGYLRMGSHNLVHDLGYRVANQSQVWFGILDRFRGTAAVAFTDIFGETSLDHPAGLDYLSYLVAKYDFVHPRLEQGIPFTMGGPPGVLSVFGLWGGFVLYSLMGFFYAVSVIAATLFLRAGSPIGGAAWFVMYVAVGLGTQMGYWDGMYGTLVITSLIVSCLIAGWRLLLRRRPMLATRFTIRSPKKGPRPRVDRRPDQYSSSASESNDPSSSSEPL